MLCRNVSKWVNTVECWSCEALVFLCLGAPPVSPACRLGVPDELSPLVQRGSGKELIQDEKRVKREGRGVENVWILLLLLLLLVFIC